MKRYIHLLLLLLLVSLALPPARAATTLELKKGDHIALIGNTLADRLQHSGDLESMIYTQYPRLDLVFRHLGYSGDQLTERLRSEDFGSQDEWLKHEKADVIFAFFGFNESFKGNEGLAQYRKDLEKFIQTTLKQDYSGKGAPRLVLFSPIAAEKHADSNFADPTERNALLKTYSATMAEVARANGVIYVDLLAASQQAYARTKQSLTINGIHLSNAGYQALAPAMFQGLFGQAAPETRGAAFEKLLSAVNDKNKTFFLRYRTMDGYNVYGGRSHLTFNGIKNRDAMLREMDMRDVMTANRDQRVWAVSQGGDLVVKDDNLPAPVEIPTNKPGKNPDGSHAFLSGEEAIKHMKVPPGCKVTLFASEEQFPQLSKPVQMAFDTQGRLWVAVWPNYPERTPQSKDGDKLLVFEDTNGDGKADKCTTFVDDLNCPTGFQFYKDGVILVQAPDVWFLRDTDGDGKADWKERVLNGLDSADSHHTANALALDPSGAIYLSDGVFHRTQVETAAGLVRNKDAAIYRFEPRTSKFETYISYGFANPHGRVFDAWGNDLVTDATGNNTYFGPAISGRIDYPAKHPGIKQFWERPSRPCPGTGMLSSRHFPEEYQNTFLNCNVIGFQGIYRVKVKEDGSGLTGETVEPPMVVSDDPNFRPSAVGTGPDGAVWFLDWHNPIIGHMQHHIRDPNRDHVHGRIYRITYENRPLLQPVKVAGEPIEKLVALLSEPEDDVRLRAKIELGARDSKKVVAAVQQWAKQLDPKKVAHQHALMEALWVHAWHNVVNESLLQQMLQSPEPRARAAAVHVLCYWRDRVSQPLALLHTAANDAAPRVRLEAVRTASFFSGTDAMEVAYQSLNHESDYYLDYVFKETTRALQKGNSDIYLPKDPKILASVLSRLSDKELLKANDMDPVLVERLERKGMELNTRNAALDQLVKRHKTDRVTEIVAALKRLENREGNLTPTSDLGLMLAVTPSTELVKGRPTLAALAQASPQASVRRAAYAGLVAADGKPDTAWKETLPNPAQRASLIDSIILQADPSARMTFQPLLAQTLADASTPVSVRVAALRALPLMGRENAGKNFGLLASHLRQGQEMSTAAQAVMQLPREVWVKEQAAPAAEAILSWAKTIPASGRTAQEFVETVQVGNELAVLLPAADSNRIRRELLDLGVSVFPIKSVREEMRYDVTRIVVEAGKPFEIVFENIDMMPHNLVIVQPGAREEVGLQAQTMSPTPDKTGRVFVPKNKKIIASSKLLEPGQKETLKLVAPKEAGNYDYLCTYPEHWKVMYGQLVVVKDKESILQAGAQAPAAQAAAAHQHNHH